MVALVEDVNVADVKMRIEITKPGNLVIDNIEKACPYASRRNPYSTFVPVQCGQWCPFFSTHVIPIGERQVGLMIEHHNAEELVVEICHNKYFKSENFVDERSKPNDK